MFFVAVCFFLLSFSFNLFLMSVCLDGIIFLCLWVLSKEEFLSAFGTDNKAHLILVYLHPACFDVPHIHREAITQNSQMSDQTNPLQAQSTSSNPKCRPVASLKRHTDAALHHPLHVGQCCCHRSLSSKGQRKPGVLPFILLKSNLSCKGICCRCV